VGFGFRPLPGYLAKLEYSELLFFYLVWVFTHNIHLPQLDSAKYSLCRYACIGDQGSIQLLLKYTYEKVAHLPYMPSKQHLPYMASKYHPLDNDYRRSNVYYSLGTVGVSVKYSHTSVSPTIPVSVSSVASQKMD
jgi:hypothetical protein